MLWSNNHHYDGYAGSLICGPDEIRSAGCGSAATVDSDGHSEGSAGLNTMPQQQQCQTQMPSQAYANYAIDPLQVSFFFRVESFTSSLCHVLMSVMDFVFCFQVPIWLHCLPMKA